MTVHGTFRTWRDVRVESVMRTRADVAATSTIDPAPASAVLNPGLSGHALKMGRLHQMRIKNYH
jgi:hypothetical protein